MSRLLLFGLLSFLVLPFDAAGQTSPVPPPQSAQPNLEDRLRALEQQVKVLLDEVAALRAAGSVPSPAAPAAPTVVPAPQPATTGEVSAAGALPVYGASSAKVFNPDIGIIGNFLAATGESRGGSPTFAPTPLMTLQESEASLQAIVDPYARADFFLALGEEGIEVEEGFITLTSLPGGLLAKVGKMRADFGRLNAFHNHTLPWLDRPLVMFNLLGGETDDPDTGIKDAGVSVSRLIPAGGLFVEATGEIFRGDSGTVFQSHRRQDFSVVGRLRAYGDLSESSNIEAGTSYSRGHNDLGSAYTTQLYGVDLTYRWRPLARAIYRSFAGRTELMWSRREDVGSRTINAFGGFVSGDYQFARRWIAGGRVDWSGRGREADIRDRGASALLTFSPSEFSQIRGQYRRTRFGDQARAANELLFQFLFTIGAHGAHAF